MVPRPHEIPEKQLNKGKSIIHVSKNQLNYAIGYKGKNRNEFLTKGYELKFVADETLKDFELNVCNN